MTDCAHCDSKVCYTGSDCYGSASLARAAFADSATEKLYRAATQVEGGHYCKKTRIEEIVEFGKLMGYRRVGIAFCIGLAKEARLLADVLSPHFEVHSVCCKNGGVFKDEFGLKQILESRREVMCNPFGQARLLEEAGCELNIICGLCVGHEALFIQQSKAPVVTAITKDRVTAHNPAAALYCDYLSRRFKV
ncbi:MAG: DUF1847 domain-containing protein [Planctomycetota bacterium]